MKYYFTKPVTVNEVADACTELSLSLNRDTPLSPESPVAHLPGETFFLRTPGDNITEYYLPYNDNVTGYIADVNDLLSLTPLEVKTHTRPIDLVNDILTRRVLEKNDPVDRAENDTEYAKFITRLSLIEEHDRVLLVKGSDFKTRWQAGDLINMVKVLAEHGIYNAKIGVCGRQLCYSVESRVLYRDICWDNSIPFEKIAEITLEVMNTIPFDCAKAIVDETPALAGYILKCVERNSFKYTESEEKTYG